MQMRCTLLLYQTALHMVINLLSSAETGTAPEPYTASTTTPSIAALLPLCRAGDAQAQRTLFIHTHRSLLQVCSRYACDQPQAEDMLQEAYLVIFRDLSQYRSEGSFEGWLRRVTMRAALRYLRRSNPLRFATEITTLPDEQMQFHPDPELNGEALLYHIRQLTPACRVVFNMRCIDGYSYAEIAAELDVAEVSVRSRYARACKQLREALGNPTGNI